MGSADCGLRTCREGFRRSLPLPPPVRERGQIRLRRLSRRTSGDSADSSLSVVAIQQRPERIRAQSAEPSLTGRISASCNVAVSCFPNWEGLVSRVWKSGVVSPLMLVRADAFPVGTRSPLLFPSGRRPPSAARARLSAPSIRADRAGVRPRAAIGPVGQVDHLLAVFEDPLVEAPLAHQPQVSAGGPGNSAAIPFIIVRTRSARLAVPISTLCFAQPGRAGASEIFEHCIADPGETLHSVDSIHGGLLRGILLFLPVRLEVGMADFARYPFHIGPGPPARPFSARRIARHAQSPPRLAGETVSKLPFERMKSPR